ncbi:MAG: hypothetical protein M1541_07100, partial [Acidobacteria bacterium]|nr:hypothetical protein [Acidobacteriota bacterium]
RKIRFLLDRRCSDGGWNYGNRRVYKVDLPSFEETTALGLLALRGAAGIDVRPSLECAQRFWAAGASPLARAWLAIALRNHGVDLPECAPTRSLTVRPDVLVTALEALGCAEGRYWLLGPRVIA